MSIRAESASAAGGTLASTARMAGVLYVIVIVCAGFAEVVRSSLVVSGDAAATAENILDSELLFRVGFSSDVLAFSADVALALALYVLLKPVNEALALLAGLFRVAQAATLGINMLNQFMAILLLSGAEYLAVFEPEQLDALALLAMDGHSYGYLLGLVFFSFSNLVLGYLVLRSGYLPAVLGIALMVFVPAGYLIDSFTHFADAESSTISTIVLIPATLAEVGFALWLLVKGVKKDYGPTSA